MATSEGQTPDPAKMMMLLCRAESRIAALESRDRGQDDRLGGLESQVREVQKCLAMWWVLGPRMREDFACEMDEILQPIFQERVAEAVLADKEDEDEGRSRSAGTISGEGAKKEGGGGCAVPEGAEEFAPMEAELADELSATPPQTPSADTVRGPRRMSRRRWRHILDAEGYESWSVRVITSGGGLCCYKTCELWIDEEHVDSLAWFCHEMAHISYRKHDSMWADHHTALVDKWWGYWLDAAMGAGEPHINVVSMPKSVQDGFKAINDKRDEAAEKAKSQSEPCDSFKFCNCNTVPCSCEPEAQPEPRVWTQEMLDEAKRKARELLDAPIWEESQPEPPTVVCPTCGGDGCAACEDTGEVPEPPISTDVAGMMVKGGESPKTNDDWYRAGYRNGWCNAEADANEQIATLQRELTQAQDQAREYLKGSNTYERERDEARENAEMEKALREESERCESVLHGELKQAREALKQAEADTKGFGRTAEYWQNQHDTEKSRADAAEADALKWRNLCDALKADPAKLDPKDVATAIEHYLSDRQGTNNRPLTDLAERIRAAQEGSDG